MTKTVAFILALQLYVIAGQQTDVGACRGNDVEKLSASTGQPVSLPCHTSSSRSVDWTFQRTRGSEPKHLYLNGLFVNGNANYYKIDRNRTGDHNLLIRNVQANDSGLYICTEEAGLGTNHCTNLSVTGYPVAPSTTTKKTAVIADVGQLVRLPCRTVLNAAVDWTFSSPSEPDVQTICQNGFISPSLSDRFALERRKQGEHNLVISKTRQQDSGEYKCIEDAGLGASHAVHLIVSNSERNILARVGSTATLSCRAPTTSRVRWNFYEYGTNTPTLLYNGYAQSDRSLSLRAQVTVGDEGDVSALDLGDVQRDNAGKYACAPEDRFTVQQVYQLVVVESDLFCNITTSYSLKDCDTFEIHCYLNYTGNVSPNVTCSIGQISKVLESKRRGSSATSVTSSKALESEHCRCSANVIDSLDSGIISWESPTVFHVADGCKSSDVLAAAAGRQSPAVVCLTSEHLVIIALVIVILMLVVTVFVLCCHTDFIEACRKVHLCSTKNPRSESRKGHRSRDAKTTQDNDDEGQVLVPMSCPPKQGIFVKFDLEFVEQSAFEKEVCGICVHGEQLYVARKDQKEVDVYNRQTMERLDRLYAPDDNFEPPSCLACDSSSGVLYIAYHQCKIIRVIKISDGGSRKWSLEKSPDAISTSSQGLLVVHAEVNELAEYTTDGKFLTKIALQSAIVDPCFAVQIYTDNYLVCYGQQGKSKCGLCLVDFCGKVIRIIDSRTLQPVHLAPGPQGSVFVVDCQDNKVAMLSSDLTYIGEVKLEGGILRPFRICLDETFDRMYVADRRVSSFNVSYTPNSEDEQSKTL